MSRRRPVVALCAVLAALALTAGSCEDSPTTQPPAGPVEPIELTFGVYGPPAEIAAYAALVETYNAGAEGTEVTIKSWPDRGTMLEALADGERRPDVFQVSRRDLLGVTTQGVNRPVLELLDERGVDFGDGYSRDALMAFSENGELQCMPYGISPQVLYYNTELIDFQRMTALGLDAPTPDEPLEIGPDVDELATEEAEEAEESAESPDENGTEDADGEQGSDPSAEPTDASPSPDEDGEDEDGAEPDDERFGPPTYRRWSFEQFVAAAEFASRPRRGSKGVYVEPTLGGLEPFIYAAGGRVFDDNDDPMSLAFSDDSTREALSTILPVLRNAAITPTEEELDGTTALQLFKDGDLGILPGYRSLTPELRATEGLSFDVMPIPTIETSATVGDVTALCISERARGIAQAADFLVYVVSDEAVARVTASGFLVPANLKVLQSEDFLAPDQQPNNSTVFTTTLRDLRPRPLLDQDAALAAAVDPTVELLMTTPILTDLAPLTVQIDEESRAALTGTLPEDQSESESESESSED